MDDYLLDLNSNVQVVVAVNVKAHLAGSCLRKKILKSDSVVDEVGISHTDVS